MFVIAGEQSDHGNLDSIFEGVGGPLRDYPLKDKKYKTKRTKTIKAIASLRSQ